MDFKKDLLLIDTELSGLDVDRHEVLQLAAVLLDKKTLKEKKSFVSYVRPKKWNDRDLRSMQVNGITWEMVKSAPNLAQVIKKFNAVFPAKKVILSYYVGVADINFLQAAYKKAKSRWPFDYHYFNIWGLFFSFLAKHNLLSSKKDFAGFGLESLLKHFKIKIPLSMHDALTDCRMEAEVLRRVVKKL